MNRSRVVLLTAALLLAACSDVETPASEAGASPVGTPAVDTPAPTDAASSNPNCDPAIDWALTAWAEAGFSGTVAISSGGDFECRAGYGIADRTTETSNAPETVFSIGSVTKAFTAAAVVDLTESGVLSLTDRAGDLVDGLTGPAAEVTVEQLLLHTSGLTGSHGQDHEPLSREEAVAAISGLGQSFEPGIDYLYSNAGYTLLALIVEDTSGSSYREYTATEILTLPGGDVAGGFWDGEPTAPDPRAVGYRDDGTPGQAGDFSGPHWALDGNGGLAMSMEDLATWTHALFTGELISPEAAEVISTPRFDHGDGRSETPGWVAFDESTFGEPLLGFAGGGGDVGHNVVVVWLPESERVVAMASNTPDVTAEDLLQTVGEALVTRRPLPTPTHDRETDPGATTAASGSYQLDTGGLLDVAVEGDGLAITATGADAIAALFPLSDGSSADDIEAHEGDLMVLLAGETQVGREEVELLESDIGTIESVELAGTIVDDGELRSYVTIVAGDGPVLAWYALDDQGGISAVELGPDPPALLMVPAGDGEFRPGDPTGGDPDVTVTFDGDVMTLAGPDSYVTATRD